MKKLLEVERIALQFNEYINHRNLQGLYSLMTDNHVFVDSVGNRVEGKEANLKNWRKFFDLFPDYQNIFQEVHSEGNIVIMRGYSTCSYKQLNTEAVWTAKVEGNKLTEWRVCQHSKI